MRFVDKGSPSVLGLPHPFERTSAGDLRWGFSGAGRLPLCGKTIAQTLPMPREAVCVTIEVFNVSYKEMRRCRIIRIARKCRITSLSSSDGSLRRDATEQVAVSPPP